ncbi:unnamed protein product [Symbiodinium natans]|uniref:Uncharacterized protein n=1 Tax=Symbiodinium natans TaxID=878477 RepID=A0A812LMK8_9DINO|nr:unnamed protein product [Symbiodinium natans]
MLQTQGGFSSESQVRAKSEWLNLRGGGYVFLEYWAESGRISNGIDLFFPKFAEVQGAVIFAQQGVTKRYDFSANSGQKTVLFHGAVPDAELVVEIKEVTRPKISGPTVGTEEFSWNPGAFPDADGVEMTSQSFEMKDGGYFFIVYHSGFRRQIKYFKFDFPSWIDLNATATVTAQGVRKQYVISERNTYVQLRGAILVSEITLAIESVVRPIVHDPAKFVWEPTEGFPTEPDQEIVSDRYNMKEGGYYFIKYFAEGHYNSNRFSFDFPGWLKVAGTATVVAQGISKQFPVSCDDGTTVLKLYGAKRVSKLTLVINEVVMPELNVTGPGKEEFVWMPSREFPTEGQLVSDRYNMKEGGYYFIKYFADDRYGPNRFTFDFPGWLKVAGTATVVAQGISKQFPVRCNDGYTTLKVYGSKRISKLTFVIDEAVMPELNVTDSGKEEFVWKPSGEFPTEGQLVSDRYNMKEGGYYFIKYLADDSYGPNRFRFDFPGWLKVAGTATVVAQGISKQFPVSCNDGYTTLKVYGSKRISKLTVVIDEAVMPELNVTDSGKEEFVWKPSSEFPTEGQLMSDRYNLKEGGYYFIKYFADDSYGPNRFRFDFPGGLKVAGTATVVAQGISKQFPVSCNDGYTTLKVYGSKRISKLTFVIDEAVMPELNVTDSGKEEFVWKPSGEFPTEGQLVSDRYNMKEGGYYFIKYFADDRYGPNRFRFDFPGWLKVAGAATVVAQGISKQFPVSCDDGYTTLKVYGSKRISKLTFVIDEAVMPELNVTIATT